MDANGIRQITCADTDHFRITRDFLNAPERYLKHLLGESDGEDEDA